MFELVKRFPENPILSPKNLQPSNPGLELTCLLNPGAFRFDNKIWLLIRVAERPKQQVGVISFPILEGYGTMKIISIAEELVQRMPKLILYGLGRGIVHQMDGMVLLVLSMNSKFTILL